MISLLIIIETAITGLKSHFFLLEIAITGLRYLFWLLGTWFYPTFSQPRKCLIKNMKSKMHYISILSQRYKFQFLVLYNRNSSISWSGTTFVFWLHDFSFVSKSHEIPWGGSEPKQTLWRHNPKIELNKKIEHLPYCIDQTMVNFNVKCRRYCGCALYMYVYCVYI